MEPDDLALLESSVEAALAPHADLTATDAALAELGWTDMLAAEPITATAVVFERLGRADTRSGALDDVVARHLGLPLGEALIHPTWGAAEPSGHRDGARVDVEGTAWPRVRTADRAHVLLPDGVAMVRVDALELRAFRTDEDLSRVFADRAEVLDWSPLPPEALTDATAAARLALGHQLHGCAAAMLALARDHAVDRVQFGRPIASFQAVRHKLAETHVAIESAAEALVAADDDPSPLTVDLARVLAGRAAREAARHCQQVLAGIGFTRDHDFHRHLFTALELDGLYGTTVALTTALGRRLLAERAVPRVVDL